MPTAVPPRAAARPPRLTAPVPAIALKPLPWLLALAAGGGAFHAGRALAQDASPGVLAPVTVTAERRAENIKDVPSSIGTIAPARSSTC